jgi:hypothetical protein
MDIGRTFPSGSLGSLASIGRTATLRRSSHHGSGSYEWAFVGVVGQGGGEGDEMDKDQR